MKNFIEFMKQGITPYHSVAAGKEMLREAGFQEVSMEDAWDFTEQREKQCGYMTSPVDGVLYAWVVEPEYRAGDAIRIGIAHTDYPCLHIKPAGMIHGAYELLDVEVYGGPILPTWLDRPLGIAGRVMVEEEGRVVARLFDSAAPVVTIPNLPIHFNREVNKGVELKRQIDMRPLAGRDLSKNWLTEYVCERLNVEACQLLDFDLYVYLYEAPVVTGVKQDLLLAPRLDNQTSCYALLAAICEKLQSDAPAAGLSLIALYDNEEVGSTTRGGADSALASMLLEKIYDGMAMDGIRLKEAILKGRCLSLDVAHALHPNHPERFDAENTGKMGDGVIIKLSSTQRYAYEAVAVAEAVQICKKQQIAMHRHVNHSDQPGGSTMGPIFASWLPMPTIDMGVPLMAMHSACELMALSDEEALVAFAKAFLE